MNLHGLNLNAGCVRHEYSLQFWSYLKLLRRMFSWHLKHIFSCLIIMLLAMRNTSAPCIKWQVAYKVYNCMQECARTGSIPAQVCAFFPLSKITDEAVSIYTAEEACQGVWGQCFLTATGYTQCAAKHISALTSYQTFCHFNENF